MGQTKTILGLTTALTLAAGAASAVTLNISVTNTQGDGGFAVTPLYTGFHNGDFDAFTVGEAATAGVEEIAETGMAAPVAGERVAADANSVGTVSASPEGPPPIEAGETVTTQIEVESDSALYLTYLAMLLPSNDTFIGNDDARAHQILDDEGNFAGPLTIDVTAANAYDAGTELNALEGSAFVAGQDITLSPAENGVITAATDQSIFAGVELASGAILGSADQLDFSADPSAFSILQIQITEADGTIAPVPLPASGLLMLAGLGSITVSRRRRKA